MTPRTKNLLARAGKSMRRVKEAYQTHGIGGAFRLLERWALITFCLMLRRPFWSCTRFSLGNTSYRYFYHWYNATYMNERTVEVPIIWQFVTSNRGKTILEVGNVLSHYYAVDHDIVDKYESSPGVINDDVVNFKATGKKYELIISISTLEHVGWDETPREPRKPLRAVENLVQLLAPGGMIVITIPVGQNPELDVLLRENRIPFTGRLCLARVSQDNIWEQVCWDQIRNAKYNTPFFAANGLLIGFIKQA
jgi:hypothetical protein